MIDQKATKLIWFVWRSNRGSWQEIYRTPNEQDAYDEAERMKCWDAPTKVTARNMTFIVSKGEA